MPLTNKASDPVCSVRLGCSSAWVVASFLSADGRYKTRAMVNGHLGFGWVWVPTTMAAEATKTTLQPRRTVLLN